MVTILLKLAAGAVIALEIDRRLQQLREHTDPSPEQDGSRDRTASDNATGEKGYGRWQLGRGEAGKTSIDADSDGSGKSSGLRSLQERGRYW